MVKSIVNNRITKNVKSCLLEIFRTFTSGSRIQSQKDLPLAKYDLGLTLKFVSWDRTTHFSICHTGPGQGWIWAGEIRTELSPHLSPPCIRRPGSLGRKEMTFHHLSHRGQRQSFLSVQTLFPFFPHHFRTVLSSAFLRTLLHSQLPESRAGGAPVNASQPLLLQTRLTKLY